MSLFKLFGTSPKKETEGVKVTFTPNADGSVPTFIITRASRNNKNYLKTAERETRQFRREIDLGIIDAARTEEIRLNIFIGSILLGWENVQDVDNKPLSYSAENAKLLFKALPDLFDELESQARTAVLFRDEMADAATKN